MTHAEMDELYELYALGALEDDAASEIEQHLAEGCAYCSERMQDAVYATAMLSSLAEPVEPPPAVRTRLLAGLDRTRVAIAPPVVAAAPAVPQKTKRPWSFAIPALAAACIALLAFSVWSVIETQHVRTDLNRMIGERDQLRSALEILSRSETRTVKFGASDNVAHGRVLVNKSGGFVFVGSGLPQIGSDRTFELWLVPPKGAPQPAGLGRANASGALVHVSRTPIDPNQVAAVAVSVEPQGGSNAPTTKPFLIVPLG
jgi:anti-sigma-K factor RskA